MMMDIKEIIKKHSLNINGVLHCGASTGQEAVLYDEICKNKVIWVEAIPDVYNQLNSNLQSYPKQQAINACIGDEDGKDVVFNISNNESQSSSFLELGEHANIHPEVHYIDKFSTVTTRLDTLLKNIDIKGINFLNLDLQGSEYMALCSLGDLLSQFDYLWIEVNKKETYKGCMLIDDLDTYLLSHKFARVETGDWVGDCWTDALYIKSKQQKGNRNYFMEMNDERNDGWTKQHYKELYENSLK